MLTDRRSLFQLQTIIAFIAVILVIFIVYTPPESWLKVVIAPFGAISLVLFSLFSFNKEIEDFNSEPYATFNIIASIIILFSVLVGMHFLISVLDENRTLDKVIFYSSIFIGFLAFLYLRIGNLWSMAIITGIAEGVIVHTIFFHAL